MQAPVRMVWDRVESIRGHSKRHPFRIRHRLGADRRGTLVAARIDMLGDAGCYASSSAAVIANALSQSCGPYAIERCHLVGRAVYTNNPYTGAFRGFGVNQATFAMEQQINKWRTRSGSRLRSCGGGTSSARRAPRHGAAGVCVWRSQAHGGRQHDARATPAAAARAGPVAVRPGHGQRAQEHRVQFRLRRSRDGPRHGHTTRRHGVGRRIGGRPGHRDRARSDCGRRRWDCRRARYGSRGTTRPRRQQPEGRRPRTRPSSRATRFAWRASRPAWRLAVRGGQTRLPPDGVTATSTFQAPSTDPLTSAAPTRHAYSYAWSACVADVGVDLETGRVRVLRVVNALDAGRVINPKLLEGQVEGGVVMGQGYALQESVRRARRHAVRAQASGRATFRRPSMPRR